MTSWKSRWNEMLTELQQERDELRVKLSLGKAELKDELDELDEKMDTVRARAAVWIDKADDELDEAVAEAREKASEWLGEIKAGYARMKDQTKE